MDSKNEFPDVYNYFILFIYFKQGAHGVTSLKFHDISITTHLFSIERADWSKQHDMFKARDVTIKTNADFRLIFVPVIRYLSTLLAALLLV